MRPYRIFAGSLLPGEQDSIPDRALALAFGLFGPGILDKK